MQSLVLNLIVLAALPALAAQDPSNLPATISDLPTVTTMTVTTGPPPPPASQTGCPTVTATRELCQTCAVPLCLGLATVTQSCGCPTPVPTGYLDFPCKDNCKGIWCSTSYAIVTATETCSGGGSKPTTGSASLPTAGVSQTPSTGVAKPTESVVTVNAAGRIAVPLLGGWF